MGRTQRRSSRMRALTWFLLGLGVSACEGRSVMNGSGLQPESSWTPDPSYHAPGPGPGASAKAELCAIGMDPGPTFLRRLTNVEYANAVRDLVQAIDGLTADFPLDNSKNGFDNNSELITMSTSQVDAYRKAS